MLPMKVIIFGGSGFLGSHVADELSNAGHEVTIYDTKHSKYLRSSQRMVVGNITDENKVRQAISGCDIVYNFAGIADIDKAGVDPVLTTKYNILGNTLILDAAKKEGIERYIFASSLYVYSKSGSFYSSSKQACELFIENYHEVYGLNYTILRFGSLYGSRANEHNGIYRYLLQAVKEGKITYYGTGEEIREYIHVEDAAKACVQILEPEFENRHIIITGNQSLKAQDLMMMIREMFGGNLKIEYHDRLSPAHYRVTPYSFNPKVGKKLTSNFYTDMGQGILNLLAEIHHKVHSELSEKEDILIENNLSGDS